MSYFPNMFRSPEKGMTAYLLHVGTHGAMAIYHLDADGKPDGFVAGDIKEVVGEALKQFHPHLRLGDFRTLGGEAPAYPHDWGLGWHARWRDAVKCLNGKGVRSARIKAKYELLTDHFGLAIPAIEPDPDSWGYRVTEAGIAADARWDEEERAREAARAAREAAPGEAGP